MTLELHGIDSR